jgi:Fic family protein
MFERVGHTLLFFAGRKKIWAIFVIRKQNLDRIRKSRPSAPGQVGALMDGLTSFANGFARDIDPIVAASVISFGFVFIHPFMDGNGRLSRCLFHHALCQSGKLERGFMLPVSIAMKRNEADYLAVLNGFSKKARRCWDVTSTMWRPG